MTEFFGMLALILGVILALAVYEVYRLRSVNAALTNQLNEAERKAAYWQTAWSLEKMYRNAGKKTETSGLQALRDSLIT